MISDRLPKISCLTVLDRYMMYSYCIMGILVVVSCVQHSYSRDDQKDANRDSFSFLSSFYFDINDQSLSPIIRTWITTCTVWCRYLITNLLILLQILNIRTIYKVFYAALIWFAINYAFVAQQYNKVRRNISPTSSDATLIEKFNILS